jgi:hypothetical protein
MISWETIFAGAAMSVAFAAIVLLLVLRERRPLVIIVALISTLLGPLAWNAILHRTRPGAFFVDIPFKPFPVSWQDTGSGVFTLALASVLLGLLLRREPAGEVLKLAVTVALVAFLVDIYLY